MMTRRRKSSNRCFDRWAGTQATVRGPLHLTAAEPPDPVQVLGRAVGALVERQIYDDPPPPVELGLKVVVGQFVLVGHVTEEDLDRTV